MSETQGTSGFGTRFLRSDGGAANGAKAALTKGTSNQQVLYTAKKAGTVPNAYTIAHLGGVSQSLAVTVVGSAITVQLATDGSSVVTSTASDVIDAVNAHTGASALVVASNGTGNGSGLAVASAAAALTGGTLGSEIFTDVAEVTNISGPDEALELIDATHMRSPDARREYISSLLDSGEISLDLNFLPSVVAQSVLRQDMADRARTRYAIVWSDLVGTNYVFKGFVTAHGKSAQIDDKLTANVTVKVTGAIAENEVIQIAA